jgi:hypothetical protein
MERVLIGYNIYNSNCAIFSKIKKPEHSTNQNLSKSEKLSSVRFISICLKRNLNQTHPSSEASFRRQSMNHFCDAGRNFLGKTCERISTMDSSKIMIRND